MSDRDLLEWMKKEGEHIHVPEELQPKAVEKLLESGRQHKKKRWRKYIAAAAAFLLILGGIGGGVGLSHVWQSKEQSKVDEGYSELYKLLRQINVDTNYSLIDMAAEQKATQKEAAGVLDNTQESAQVVADAEESYSGTNVQTEGVDEGDIVKTDGTFIYVLDQAYGTISIIHAQDGNMKKSAVISLDDNFYPTEFYLTGNKLTVLGIIENNDLNKETTGIFTYDIHDKTNPGKGQKLTQSGTLSSSRVQDGYLYVFSSYYPTLPVNEKIAKQYVPMAGGRLFKMPEIQIPANPQETSYLVMTAINLEKPEKICDRQSVLSAGEIFYVSGNHIYAASGGSRNTEIHKFSYGKGRITYESTGSVKGYLENSFSMDEYQGNLRLVTTLNLETGGSYNNVYVLDENMKKIGSILKLAKDERIYSARFMGETGYFVTFRETDPLFSVDFSDPTNPKIIGKLKIPGFSEYLHFYGEGQLLGIGMEADEEGVTGGVKLSMFDIRNPKNVKEVDSYVLEGSYSAEALENHHAVMIDPEKNIFGFAVDEEDGASYYLFQYKDGFQKLFRTNAGSMSYHVRGLYIGDIFYLVQIDRIKAYKLKNMKELGNLKI